MALIDHGAIELMESHDMVETAAIEMFKLPKTKKKQMKQTTADPYDWIKMMEIDERRRKEQAQLLEELKEERKENEKQLESLNKNLWQKETTKRGKELYIDIFDAALGANRSNRPDREVEMLSKESEGKDNETSREMRKKGNQIVCPSVALDMYNKSLRYAEVGSLHATLAYANRAACYYTMQYYGQALENIKLAKRDKKFPKHLLQKLNGMQHWAESYYIERKAAEKSQLSYVANEQHPCMSAVLSIKTSPIFGRYLRAKYKLKKLDVILIERDYIAAMNTEKVRSCATCYEEDKDFIPCDGCAGAMFCNEHCKNVNSVHKWECNTFVTKLEFRLRLFIQSILMAIDAFTVDGMANVGGLMKCVEDMLDEKRNKTTTFPSSTLDPKSRYQFFFKLTSSMKLFEYTESYMKLKSIQIVYTIYSLLMKIPKIEAIFAGEKKRRFLQHLIAHHIFVINNNSFGDDDSQSLGLLQSLFNHSCKPNIFHRKIAKEHYFFAGKKVKRKEQLFISYIEVKDIECRYRRREVIERSWGFICNCILCEPKRLSISDKLNDAIKTILYNRFDVTEDGTEDAIEGATEYTSERTNLMESVLGSTQKQPASKITNIPKFLPDFKQGYTPDFIPFTPEHKATPIEDTSDNTSSDSSEKKNVSIKSRLGDADIVGNIRKPGYEPECVLGYKPSTSADNTSSDSSEQREVSIKSRLGDADDQIFRRKPGYEPEYVLGYKPPSGAPSLESTSEDTSTPELVERVTIATIHRSDDTREYPSAPSLESTSEDTTTPEVVERVTIATIHRSDDTREYQSARSLESTSEDTSTPEVVERVTIATIHRSDDTREYSSAENSLDEKPADSAPAVESEKSVDSASAVEGEIAVDSTSAVEGENTSLSSAEGLQIVSPLPGTPPNSLNFDTGTPTTEDMSDMSDLSDDYKQIHV
ncbi:uncharacterized protein LOC116341023 isoform X3 [Contarinia nasturtii]|uniref:uncharacterized protein LOC116341023 isoform X3 n=1 Tax=Contarinia nasturtii TaxID=265458 RepID=UPI0012D485A2|nr:uncharacterized protein LOC116341023 isoform X3 [Contarinia nasturtii]